MATGSNPAAAATAANPASVSSAVAVGANPVANWAGGPPGAGGHGTTAAAIAQLAAAQNQALQIAAAQQVGTPIRHTQRKETQTQVLVSDLNHRNSELKNEIHKLLSCYMMLRSFFDERMILSVCPNDDVRMTSICDLVVPTLCLLLQ